MNRILFLRIVLLSAVCCTSLAVAAKRDDTTEMIVFLKTNELITFASQMKSRNWEVPVIYSQWYVDRLTNSEQQVHEQKNRDFGRLMTVKLSNVACAVAHATSWSNCNREAAALLVLGNWFGSRVGYGNHLLAVRCHDIACVALVKMIADLDAPTNEVGLLVPLLNSSWKNVNRSVDILNLEVGMPLFVIPTNFALVVPQFPAPITNEVKRCDYLSAIWRYGTSLARSGKHEGYTLSTNLSHIKTDVIGDHLFGMRRQTITYGFTPLFNSNLFFFADTDVAGPRTIVRTWDAKMHKDIIYYRPITEKHVSYFARFRAAVGFFPTNGVANSPFQSPISAAFDREWGKHITDNCSKDDYYVGSCAVLYEEYLKGVLKDRDSHAEDDYCNE